MLFISNSVTASLMACQQLESPLWTFQAPPVSASKRDFITLVNSCIKSIYILLLWLQATRFCNDPMCR